MGEEDWFDQRKPQAVQKHGILARYAYYFAGRAGKATRDRVAFVDAYAGQGKYGDGSPGSPLLLLDEAERAALLGRDVHLEFVEVDRNNALALKEALVEAGLPTPNLRIGVFEEVLEEIQLAIGRRATLYFIDPFSLGLPFDDLVELLRSSGRDHPVDVIYHFSSSTVARLASRIVQAADSDPMGDMPEGLDRALGPDVDWQSAFEALDENRDGGAYPLGVDISRQFAVSVAERAGVRSTVIEVKPRPDRATIYTLVLFSRNPQAHWDYCDIAGAAYIDWLHKCDVDDFEANLQRIEDGGAVPFDMFRDPEPDRGDIDERFGQEALEYLTEHIFIVLYEYGRLRFIDNPALIYGDYLGRARAQHLRAAVKRLYREGKIEDRGVGDFWKRFIEIKR